MHRFARRVPHRGIEQRKLVEKKEMLDKRLKHAFSLTDEEHADAFERFANAFLVDDYPELEALGAKRDKGMDARIAKEDGKNILVVQSCISPTKTARTKVLGTFGKLNDNLPETLVYCTSARIGVALDETKMQLRQSKVRLDVCDAAWFVQRALTSDHRITLSESFAHEVLSPILDDLKPNRLYSQVLTDEEEIKVARYLELHSLDRQKGRNLTKAIFEGMVISVIYECATFDNVEDVVTEVAKSFPEGHRKRINDIVPPTLKKLVEKKTIKQSQGGKLSLSAESNAHVKKLEESRSEREIMFRATIADMLKSSVDENEIDYSIDSERYEQLIHQCIVWYMREQGRQLLNPIQNLVNVLNTEELVGLYLDANEDYGDLDREQVLDIVPTAVYSIISNRETHVHDYLRSKSDLFISQAFLQADPDVQKACKKLFGRDLIYVDTTVLVHCLAELYEPGSPKLLTSTLVTACKLGVKIRTFRPFVEEVVSHLKGPVLREWLNHYQGKSTAEIVGGRAVPRLIEVFELAKKTTGKSVEELVRDVIGKTNQIANAIEFIQEEFKIEVDEISKAENEEEHSEWETIFGEWLGAKKRYSDMDEAKFETLVRNDVNAFSSVKRLRKNIKVEGDDYGFKVWLLTLDRMYWKIPRLIRKSDDYRYHVAMSMDYLANFVATLSTMSTPDSDISLPASLISQVGGFIPTRLKDKVSAELEKETNKYLKRRKIRELVHEAKTSGWEIDPLEDKRLNDF